MMINIRVKMLPTYESVDFFPVEKKNILNRLMMITTKKTNGTIIRVETKLLIKSILLFFNIKASK